MPDGLNHRAFSSGDVLLSHGLSPYYHRGCSVSLPCSEWERVGPVRDSHQTPAPIFGEGFWCVIGDPLNRYNGCRLWLRFYLLLCNFLTFQRFAFNCQRTPLVR